MGGPGEPAAERAPAPVRARAAMTILSGDNLFPDRRWPLHPQPRDWEGLENWVRRIAVVYGVSYDAFLKHALGRTGRGARDLDRISDADLARLSAGTGVSVERVREMNGASIKARMNALQDGSL